MGFPQSFPHFPHSLLDNFLLSFTYFLFLFILIQTMNSYRIGSDDMKIEKINDNQIRCTLTHADLADRQIKFSEIVCGSDKAKSLFQDMMQQAASEFGFEAEDMPLMIEAVPAASDTLVLIITKVDNPEELDSKLSKFGSALQDLGQKKQTVSEKLDSGDKNSRIRLFSFANLDCVILACHLLRPMYIGANTLYKDIPNNVYILALTQSDLSTSDFNKICNMLSEYGAAEKVNSAILAFLEEHCEVIVSNNAVEQLGNL